MKVCPACQVKNPDTRDQCLSCGVPLPGGQYWVCPACGEHRPADDDKCTSCGYRTGCVTPKAILRKLVPLLQKAKGNMKDVIFYLLMGASVLMFLLSFGAVARIQGAQAGTGIVSVNRYAFGVYAETYEILRYSPEELLERYEPEVAAGNPRTVNWLSYAYAQSAQQGTGAVVIVFAVIQCLVLLALHILPLLIAMTTYRARRRKRPLRRIPYAFLAAAALGLFFSRLLNVEGPYHVETHNMLGFYIFLGFLTFALVRLFAILAKSAPDTLVENLTTRAKSFHYGMVFIGFLVLSIVFSGFLHIRFDYQDVPGVTSTDVDPVGSISTALPASGLNRALTTVGIDERVSPADLDEEIIGLYGDHAVTEMPSIRRRAVHTIDWGGFFRGEIFAQRSVQTAVIAVLFFASFSLAVLSIVAQVILFSTPMEKKRRLRMQLHIAQLALCVVLIFLGGFASSRINDFFAYGQGFISLRVSYSFVFATLLIGGQLYVTHKYPSFKDKWLTD